MCVDLHTGTWTDLEGGGGGGGRAGNVTFNS